MSVFYQAILEALAFIAFLAIFYGGPCLLWLWICWKQSFCLRWGSFPSGQKRLINYWSWRGS